jgi:hypothetical protein
MARACYDGDMRKWRPQGWSFVSCASILCVACVGTERGSGAGGGGTSPHASFAFIVDGVVQTPMTCVAEAWEFPHIGPPNAGDAGLGNHRVLLENTGSIAFAYTAMPLWSPPYVPGIATGEQGQVVGVLNPGQELDLTPILGAIVSFDPTGDGSLALLGSADPFLDPYVDVNTYEYDEGQIPWPAGLTLTPSAPQMFVAQIAVRSACIKEGPLW